MTHQVSTSTTVAILGTDTLAEGILARLLEHEGYNTRILEASYPMRVVDELLEGVDLLLLTPGFKADVRGAFLEDMRDNPKTAHINTLPFSAALKLALVDELSAGASWRDHFDDLIGQIRATLENAAASTRALVVDGGEPGTQADAP